MENQWGLGRVALMLLIFLLMVGLTLICGAIP